MFSLFNKKEKKVNLFIIGEQKCGTTSLHELLRTNNNILSGTVKECQYFNTEKYQGENDYSGYHKLFDQNAARAAKYLIDGTPDYLHDFDVSERIHRYNPSAKIIVVLRNPASRFISAYNFYFSNVLNNIDYVNERYFRFSSRGRKIKDYLVQKGDISIEEFFKEELSGNSPINALKRGCYSENINRWLTLFPKDSLTVLFFEYLKSSDRFNNEKKKLEQFLSLKIEGEFPEENVSKRKAELPEDLKKGLDQYYLPENEKLKSFLGSPLPWFNL